MPSATVYRQRCLIIMSSRDTAVSESAAGDAPEVPIDSSAAAAAAAFLASTLQAITTQVDGAGEADGRPLLAELEAQMAWELGHYYFDTANNPALALQWWSRCRVCVRKHVASTLLPPGKRRRGQADIPSLWYAHAGAGTRRRLGERRDCAHGVLTDAAHGRHVARGAHNHNSAALLGVVGRPGCLGQPRR